jgi:hypothetical protein
MPVNYLEFLISNNHYNDYNERRQNQNERSFIYKDNFCNLIHFAEIKSKITLFYRVSA